MWDRIAQGYTEISTAWETAPIPVRMLVKPMLAIRVIAYVIQLIRARYGPVGILLQPVSIFLAFGGIVLPSWRLTCFAIGFSLALATLTETSVARELNGFERGGAWAIVTMYTCVAMGISYAFS